MCNTVPTQFVDGGIICFNHFTGNTAKMVKSSGEIPLVVLVFAGASLLVSRLIVRHVSFEFLVFVKMSSFFFSFVSCR